VACPKGSLDSAGSIVSDTEMTFLSPDYRKFGPQEVCQSSDPSKLFWWSSRMPYFCQVQCRLKIGSAGLTNTGVGIKFFEVTSASETVVFGPGISDGCAAGDPVCLIIQAKDTNGLDRWCGMDEFSIKVIQSSINA
jgi:hypothetical protein